VSRAVFVTATGTDAGKTYVAALIIKKLRESRINAGYYKAVLSGAEYDADGRVTGSDAHYVCAVAGIDGAPEELVSYIYKTAVSPHLAARLENNPPKIEKIIGDFERARRLFDYVVVEGSGGIVCPVRRDKSVSSDTSYAPSKNSDGNIMLTDIIKAFGTDIIIVAPSGLGSINSTVLTVEYARQKGMTVKGVIMNNFDKNNPMHADNKEQTEALTGVRVIACLPNNCADFPLETKELIKIFGE
jgi:dethiobiotin synthetase